MYTVQLISTWELAVMYTVQLASTASGTGGRQEQSEQAFEVGSVVEFDFYAPALSILILGNTYLRP